MDFVQELFQLPMQRFGQGVAYVLFPLLALIAFAVFQFIVGLSGQAWLFFKSRQRALGAVAREITRDGAREGNGVWLTQPIDPPEDYRNRVNTAKILSIANLKGGVGKTTLAANIGAYLASDWGKRVLLIDLDFQGSLSSMAFPNGEWLPQHRQTSLATKLISNDLTPDLIDHVARDVPLDRTGEGAGRLKIIPAHYDLAQADNRIMVEWLLKTRYAEARNIVDATVKFFKGKLFRNRDVRYTLANILHSDAVREAFDLIIIDCPPRLTTSKVQAFCASSHLLIPTIFDRTSAEAVYSICQQVETLRQAGVCPCLKFMGVVGTMWFNNNAVAQMQGFAVLKNALKTLNLNIGFLPPKTFVPRSAFLLNSAEKGIAYLTMPNAQAQAVVRETIRELATYVAGQLGVSPPASAAQEGAAASLRQVG